MYNLLYKMGICEDIEVVTQNDQINGEEETLSLAEECQLINME